MNSDPTLWLFFGLCVVLVIMLLRMRRGMRQRRIRVEALWIGPAIFLVITALVLRSFPPPLTVAVCSILAIAAVVGFGVGWLRGRMVRISLNIETHQLMSQVTPWGMAVLLAILAARMGVRYVLNDHMQEWHISAAALTDGFLLFYLGMVIGRRVEILIRCRKILAEATAAKSAGQPVAETVTEDHA